MVTVELNGRELAVDTPTTLALLVDRLDAVAAFELLMWVENEGPLLCMLRSGEHAVLTWLPRPGDEGCCTQGDTDLPDLVEFTLPDGQQAEYPLAWCVEPEIGYRAMAYFFMNEGARPEFVQWDEPVHLNS